MSKQLDLPARLLNRILAELGWIEPFTKGWRVTQVGKHHGGEQSQDDETGIPFVTWPRSLANHPAIQESSLYFSPNHSTKEALNGLVAGMPAHASIASWLYLLGVVHAYQRTLHVDKLNLKPDFYLPAGQICIDYWPSSLAPDALSAQLSKRDNYKRYGIKAIELTQEQLPQLDHELSKALMQLGQVIY